MVAVRARVVPHARMPLAPGPKGQCRRPAKAKGMFRTDEGAGVLGWVLIIFVVLVLLGIVSFTIRW